MLNLINQAVYIAKGSAAFSRTIDSRLTYLAILIVLINNGYVSAQIAVPIISQDLDCTGIVQVVKEAHQKRAKTNQEPGIEIWVATKNGLYIVDDKTGEQEKIEGVPENIKTMFKLDSEVWISTTSGVFRINTRDRAPKQVPSLDAEIQDIASTKSATWLLTNKGVYEVTPDITPRALQLEHVTSIATGSDTLYLGTSEGLFRAVEGTSPEYLADSPKYIKSIKYIKDRVWLGTSHGLYFRDKSGVFNEVEIMGRLGSIEERDVDELVEIGGRPAFISAGDIYASTENSSDYASTEKSSDKKITFVTLASVPRKIRTVYYSQTVLGSKQTKPSGIGDQQPPSQYVLSQELWLGTEAGLFLKAGQAQRLIPKKLLSVNGLIFVNGHLWVATDKGAYRVEPGIAIKVNLQSQENWWKSIIEARGLRTSLFKISGTISPMPVYSRVDSDDQADSGQYNLVPPEFSVIMEMSQSAFERAIENEEKEYALPKNIGKELKAGSSFVYYRVRDQWGNTFDDRIPVLVVPGPIATSAFLVVGWVLSLFLMIAFAPISSVCLGLLMNRTIRKYGYFNLVPIVITILPPIRLHVLRRYRQGIREDDDLRKWQEQFIVPSEAFAPASFLALGVKQRRVLLLGQSGIGKTSYFKHLVSSYASGSIKLREGNLVPIFLSLSRYQGCQPAQMIHTQLASYGQLTDEAITLGFLERGGFLIFLDGLNETDFETRKLLSQFIELHWLRNYFFVSSQKDYHEFGGQSIHLHTLSPEKIDDMLRLRLGRERAEPIIGGLTPAIYEIYKLPQELELAIDMLLNDEAGNLPASRKELYERKLQPIFDEWEASGQSGLIIRLLERAYEMLRASETSFDSVPLTNAVPAEVKSVLLKSGLLSSRDEQATFSHEQVGAFLAAQYFVPRWRELFAEQRVVGFSWQPMLRFSMLYLENPKEVGDLFLALVEKNKFLAIDLFRWLRLSNPELMEGWAPGFERKLGQAMLVSTIEDSALA